MIVGISRYTSQRQSPPWMAGSCEHRHGSARLQARGVTSRVLGADRRTGVADVAGEHGDNVVQSADEGGEGVGAGGFAQVVLCGGG